MFKKIEQLFNEWFENAVDDEVKVILPYKYRNKKIKEIKIIFEDEES